MSKSILQTPTWAKLKEESGWQSHQIADTLVLTHSLPLGFVMAYIPEVSDKNWPIWLPQFKQEITAFAKSQKIIFARLELLEQTSNQSLLELLIKNNFIKAFEFVQPEHRQFLNLKLSDDELLSQMKQKGRYNLRLAQRHGVAVNIYSDPANAKQDAALFHNLMVATSARQKFGARPASYYETALRLLYENNAGAMFVATFQNEPLVALIISFYDGVATYLYGASSENHREVMAPYLAHWQVIQEAKKRNCHTYDLLGIAPPDSPEDNKYAGFTRFKQQFGGAPVELIGSWDLLFHPTWYTIFRQAEKRRRNLL